jgi:hypothetical protein
MQSLYQLQSHHTGGPCLVHMRCWLSMPSLLSITDFALWLPHSRSQSRNKSNSVFNFSVTLTFGKQGTMSPCGRLLLWLLGCPLMDGKFASCRYRCSFAELLLHYFGCGVFSLEPAHQLNTRRYDVIVKKRICVIGIVRLIDVVILLL